MSSFALSAMNQNKEAAVAQFVTSWGIMVPLCYYLGFVSHGPLSGFVGIMWASPISHTVKTVMGVWMLWNSQWRQHVKQTRSLQEQDLPQEKGTPEDFHAMPGTLETNSIKKEAVTQSSPIHSPSAQQSTKSLL